MALLFCFSENYTYLCQRLIENFMNKFSAVIDYLKSNAGTIKLDKPIVFFDLETTGVDVQKDRVIEIDAVRINPDFSFDEYYTKVNPECHIPDDASNVNHICDDDVADSPKFSEIVDELDTFFGNGKNRFDLGGFNITKFDVPLMVEEFRRCGKSFRYGGRRIIDPYTILVKNEPRDLKHVYQNFTGEPLENAHSAHSDTAASAAIAFRQMTKYDVKTMDELSGFVTNGMVDISGFFKRNGDGAIVFAKGKYAGRLVKELYDSGSDPNYFKYINDKCSSDVNNHLSLIVSGKEK